VAKYHSLAKSRIRKFASKLISVVCFGPLILVLMASPAKTDSVVKLADARLEIEAREEALLTHARLRDMDSYFAHFDRSFVCWPAGSRTLVGYDGFRALEGVGFTGIAAESTLALLAIETYIYGDAAICYLLYELNMRLPDGSKERRLYRAMHTWKRKASEWLLISGMTVPHQPAQYPPQPSLSYPPAMKPQLSHNQESIRSMHEKIWEMSKAGDFKGALVFRDPNAVYWSVQDESPVHINEITARAALRAEAFKRIKVSGNLIICSIEVHDDTAVIFGFNHIVYKGAPEDELEYTWYWTGTLKKKAGRWLVVAGMDGFYGPFAN
jgi:ketosteroid isomerase-like protein